MEWTKASLVRYGTIWHDTIFLYFLEKYLKNLFVLPALSSNEKNSSNHHNSYSKGPNFVFFSFTKSPSNSLRTIEFPRNHITSSYYSNMPKTTMAKIWPLKSSRGKNAWNTWHLTSICSIEAFAHNYLLPKVKNMDEIILKKNHLIDAT
jgi:hypothetical protein